MALEPNLPSFDEAQNTLLSTVYSDAYFGRLSELGHRPTTQKQAEALYEIGLGLDEAELAHTKKAEANDEYSQALAGLNQYLGKQSSAQQNRTVKAAQALAADPDIYAAALAYAVGVSQLNNK